MSNCCFFFSLKKKKFKNWTRVCFNLVFYGIDFPHMLRACYCFFLLLADFMCFVVQLQVNNVDFANIIREEAVLFLLDLPRGEEVSILAQKKKDG